jgi:hypothetical protein
MPIDHAPTVEWMYRATTTDDGLPAVIASKHPDTGQSDIFIVITSAPPYGDMVGIGSTHKLKFCQSRCPVTLHFGRNTISSGATEISLGPDRTVYTLTDADQIFILFSDAGAMTVEFAGGPSYRFTFKGYDASKMQFRR